MHPWQIRLFRKDYELTIIFAQHFVSPPLQYFRVAEASFHVLTGTVLINWRLIWTERSSCAERNFSRRGTVSWSKRVCLAATTAACASSGSTTKGFRSRQAFLAFVCNFTKYFSGVSLFESNFKFWSLRTSISHNWGSQNWSRRTVIDISRFWWVARGKIWNIREAASRKCNCKKFACWLGGSAATA